MKEFFIVSGIYYLLGLATPCIVRYVRTFIPKPWGTK